MSARVLLVAALLAFAAGCSWTVHQRDPATIAAVRLTIEARKADVGRATRALAEAASRTADPAERTRLEDERRGLEALDRAELDRLGNWLWREEQKSEEAPR